jgi:anti-sigma factor RsiW
MNCVEWEARVALHAGGDLAGAEAVEVERHLAECAACQLLWSGVRKSLAVLQAAHGELPAAAHLTAVRSRVMAELERGTRPWRRLAWISGAAAVAALALVLALALWPARVVPEPPRLLAWIPPAPEVVKPAPVVRPHVRQVVPRAPRRAPLTIKLQTADPNIVIYWIAD